jgi:hypothetical protein
MIALGGPDGSELNAKIVAQAKEAADWYGPRLHAEAQAAGFIDTPL